MSALFFHIGLILEAIPVCPSYATVTLQETTVVYTPTSSPVTLEELPCEYTPPSV